MQFGEPLRLGGARGLHARAAAGGGRRDPGARSSASTEASSSTGARGSCGASASRPAGAHAAHRGADLGTLTEPGGDVVEARLDIGAVIRRVFDIYVAAGRRADAGGGGRCSCSPASSARVLIAASPGLAVVAIAIYLVAVTLFTGMVVSSWPTSRTAAATPPPGSCCGAAAPVLGQLILVGRGRRGRDHGRLHPARDPGPDPDDAVVGGGAGGGDREPGRVPGPAPQPPARARQRPARVRRDPRSWSCWWARPATSSTRSPPRPAPAWGSSRG